MPNVIVHIGLPKTGTTSLQAFLIENRQRLAELGFVYQKPGLLGHSQVEFAFIASTQAGQLARDRILRSHLGIATLDDQKKITEKFEADFSDAVSQDPEATFLISCEQISAWFRTKELRAALNDWLEQRFGEIEYVIFARPTEKYILSVYSEAMKRGDTIGLDEFIAHRNELPIARTLSAWAQQFPGRVRVRMMPKSNRGTELYEEFCAVSGIPLAGLTIPKVHNTSLTGRQINLLRHINKWIGPPAKRGPVRRRFALRILKTVEALYKDGARLTLNPDQKARLNEKFPGSVEKTVRKLRGKETPLTERGWPVDPNTN